MQGYSECMPLWRQLGRHSAPHAPCPFIQQGSSSFITCIPFSVSGGKALPRVALSTYYITGEENVIAARSRTGRRLYSWVGCLKVKLLGRRPLPMGACAAPMRVSSS